MTGLVTRIDVSPGFRLRPSLSASLVASEFGGGPVSPGFRLRASLSDRGDGERRADPDGVAGVQTPAFVERCDRTIDHSSPARVAGVQTPAFVERSGRWCTSGASRGVSPGFRLRPSLSGLGDGGGRAGDPGVAGVQTPAFVERTSSRPTRCATPRVAGVQTPAFVERPPRHARGSAAARWCRRGSDSGLR